MHRIPSRAAALVPAAALAATLCAADPAHAYDALAKPCSADPQTCQIASVAFHHTNALPIEWSFDTGWTPQDSPLMVHLWGGVYASTRLSLAGALETSWPSAFVVRAPGAPDGGDFGFHYGAEIGAQGKIEIEILGKKYSWLGDLPYIPQFDFQVEGEAGFDAWGFASGVTIQSKTKQQKLAQIGIADIVGSSIPGIDGGFELDVAMEVELKYVTDRIVVATTDGKAISGGAIAKDGGETSAEYLGGPSIELDVHPEGYVQPAGVLHLIPAFYVELLGKTWSIPIADLPITLPIQKNEWVFESQRVHVPLPDLVLSEVEVDFGEVEVGRKNLEHFSLWNAGEATAYATVVSSDPEAFEAFDPLLVVGAKVTADSALTFVPKKNGEVKATIYVGSNDPGEPVQAVLVRGVGYGGPADVPGLQDAGQEGGCACLAAGAQADPGSGAAWALAVIGAGVVRVRRGRRIRR